MGSRKDKSIGIRLLSAIATFLLIGSVVYIFVAEINFMVGAVIVAAVLGLGIPSAVEGGSVLEVIAGCFEAFFDGLMEVIGGIFDAISSIFS